MFTCTSHYLQIGKFTVKFIFWFIGRTFFEKKVGKETSIIVWRQIKFDIYLSMVVFKFWFVELL